MLILRCNVSLRPNEDDCNGTAPVPPTNGDAPTNGDTPLNGDAPTKGPEENKEKNGETTWSLVRLVSSWPWNAVDTQASHTLLYFVSGFHPYYLGVEMTDHCMHLSGHGGTQTS